MSTPDDRPRQFGPRNRRLVSVDKIALNINDQATLDRVARLLWIHDHSGEDNYLAVVAHDEDVLNHCAEEWGHSFDTVDDVDRLIGYYRVSAKALLEAAYVTYPCPTVHWINESLEDR